MPIEIIVAPVGKRDPMINLKPGIFFASNSRTKKKDESIVIGRILERKDT